MRKWISGVFHDQDWERFEAILCLVFHETTMFSQITDKAISFQTMLRRSEGVNSGVPERMFSNRTPKKLAKGKSAPATQRAANVKTLLAYNDDIPVYDARRYVIDFDKDLDRLSQVLSRFSGEVPSGSFIIVGYTVSSYMATLSGGSTRLPHIGCNILFVIVCGTPSPARSL
ncbi:hypothetical protein B0H12DRAFT_1178325 [Mycena haematopus]|nr:hypothetical protein B0H12DRAFT_1178325 [Mycena haematopus]